MLKEEHISNSTCIGTIIADTPLGVLTLATIGNLILTIVMEESLLKFREELKKL